MYHLSIPERTSSQSFHVNKYHLYKYLTHADAKLALGSHVAMKGINQGKLSTPLRDVQRKACYYMVLNNALIGMSMCIITLSILRPIYEL